MEEERGKGFSNATRELVGEFDQQHSDAQDGNLAWTTENGVTDDNQSVQRYRGSKT